MKVVHLTTVHSRSDTRIFLKECRSLAADGHEVTLIVADGLGEEVRDGVSIVDVGKPNGRRDRMLGATRRAMRRAVAAGADVYHFHDPELLPVGLALKRRGKTVVYDAHEDVPRDILSKAYIHPILRRPIAAAAALFERFVCRRLDHVVAATPAIRDKFTAWGVEATDINNFPMLGELDSGIAWTGKAREVCYVGGIAAVRGIREIVAAMALCSSGARLNLAGSFSEKRVRAEVERTPGWTRVNELGFLPRTGVRDVLARSVAGLVTLHLTSAYRDALPIKMFEYMSAGLPVIASDFPLWREIIEGNDCGLCVDPLDAKAIAAAIDRLVNNPDLAKRMGENGRRAVSERYNWATEERKLQALYRGFEAEALEGTPGA